MDFFNACVILFKSNHKNKLTQDELINLKFLYDQHIFIPDIGNRVLLSFCRQAKTLPLVYRLDMSCTVCNHKLSNIFELDILFEAQVRFFLSRDNYRYNCNRCRKITYFSVKKSIVDRAPKYLFINGGDNLFVNEKIQILDQFYKRTGAIIYNNTNRTYITKTSNQINNQDTIYSALELIESSEEYEYQIGKFSAPRYLSDGYSKKK